MVILYYFDIGSGLIDIRPGPGGSIRGCGLGFVGWYSLGKVVLCLVIGLRIRM